MSNYTTELRYFIEMNSDESLSIDERIDQASDKLFDFKYPIFNPSYKQTLQHKIILHYYLREIGLENIARFKLYLNTRMNEIMPYYNELYTTIENKFDWLEDINYTEDSCRTSLLDDKVNTKGIGNNTQNVNDTTTSNSTGEDSGSIDNTSSSNNTSNSNSTNKNTTVNSDTPQAKLGVNDYASLITQVDASDTNTGSQNSTGTNKTTSKNNSKNDITSTGKSDLINNTTNENNTQRNSTNNDKTLSKRYGLSGSRSKTQLTTEYRESLLNIDKLIIQELKDLFINIY